MSERDARIRERAYSLWERDGKLQDRSVDYWLAAERELFPPRAAARGPSKKGAGGMARAKPAAKANGAAPLAMKAPKTGGKEKTAKAGA